MRKIAINLETQKRNAPRSLPVTHRRSLVRFVESNVCTHEATYFEFRHDSVFSIFYLTSDSVIPYMRLPQATINTVRNSPDFRNINLEWNRRQSHDCSNYPDFRVGAARTDTWHCPFSHDWKWRRHILRIQCTLHRALFWRVNMYLLYAIWTSGLGKIE